MKNNLLKVTIICFTDSKVILFFLTVTQLICLKPRLAELTRSYHHYAYFLTLLHIWL